MDNSTKQSLEERIAVLEYKFQEMQSEIKKVSALRNEADRNLMEKLIKLLDA